MEAFEATETFTIVHIDGHNEPASHEFDSIDDVISFIQQYVTFPSREAIQAELEGTEVFVSDESEDEFHLYYD